MIDKDSVREQVTEEQVFDLLASFGGEPYLQDDGVIISRTICHNHKDNEASHKLYYYPDNHVFSCYTNCGTFDIYDLAMRAYETQYGGQIPFPQAVRYVMDSAGISTFGNIKEVHNTGLDEVLNLLERLEKTNKSKSNTRLVEYDGTILKHLKPIENYMWQREGITSEIQRKFGITYHPVAQRIVIPHYDIDNRLVGIRGRAIDEVDAELYGKYSPLYVSGNMYNHPLSFNLYGINLNKTNIENSKTAIIFESEKSVMIAENYLDKNISVATCGFNISDYQMQELIDLGVNEIIIAFDRDYKEFRDDEYILWESRLMKILQNYKNYVNISIMYDKYDRLGYKDAPIDCGKEVFYELLDERQTI